MEYQKVIEQARGCIGPYCKACAVCDGRACKNTMPGPGAKGIGDVAIRNFQKWQEIRINMDTICEKRPVDTAVSLFGQEFAYPFLRDRWGQSSCITERSIPINSTTKCC